MKKTNLMAVVIILIALLFIAIPKLLGTSEVAVPYWNPVDQAAVAAIGTRVTNIEANNAVYAWVVAAVEANDAGWDWAQEAVEANDTDWDNTKDRVDSNQSIWDNAASRLDSNQISWNNAVDRLDSNQAAWDNSASRLDSNQGIWDNAASRLDANQEIWDNTTLRVDGNQITWDNAVSRLDTNQVNWDWTYDAVEANDESWDNAAGRLDANQEAWDNAALRVDTNQGLWDNAVLRLDTNDALWDNAVSRLDANQVAWDTGTFSGTYDGETKINTTGSAATTIGNASAAMTINGVTDVNFSNDSKLYITTVSLSAADINTLNSSPKELIAAPGAGNYIELISATLILDYASEFTSVANDMTIRYTNGSGAALTNTLSGTGFLDASADTIAKLTAIDVAATAATAVVDKNVVLFLAISDPTEAGTSVMSVIVSYKVHTSGLD